MISHKKKVSLITATKDDHKLRKKLKQWLKEHVMDWLLLAVLGVSMACCGTIMDLIIKLIGDLHIYILENVTFGSEGWERWWIEYAIWIGYAVFWTLMSAFCVRTISPQAIGSGIPEMKCVLRGTQLENYLTFRTLISVIIGLTFTVGSGMPIGRNGPFVHASAILANLLCRSIMSFDPHAPITTSRQAVILAAGCSVGTAVVFGSSIGGVLFAIEVTSGFFHMKNYWRGFFAAACATTISRILHVQLSLTLTIGAMFPTHFNPIEAFATEELPLFALLGVICGLTSAAFIATHRYIVTTRKTNPKIKRFFDHHWSLYPIAVAFLVSFFSYPNGIGRYMGGERRFVLTIRDMFANCTWFMESDTTALCPEVLRENWLSNGELNPFVVLTVFLVFYFFFGAIAITLPIPQGASITALTLGAALGRLFGEIVAVYLPNGLRSDAQQLINPGVYAVVPQRFVAE
ncbi:hypothetical protein M3Y96_00579000 [Aphelenchoides besseyi]|nr:hypothetical protein M3Y96_00579000 [Aphelenchoides besseyi]